ncbi:MAG: hypothetical protein J0L92_06035 [Deltaproteobacteria bacterium]|nr:hypothetical protein [Deltaproteobacteria bacterium]
MLRVRGQVRGGQIVVDDAPELPEGSEVELVMLEEPWPAELDEELERRLASANESNTIDAVELIARLRSR